MRSLWFCTLHDFEFGHCVTKCWQIALLLMKICIVPRRLQFFLSSVSSLVGCHGLLMLHFPSGFGVALRLLHNRRVAEWWRADSTTQVVVCVEERQPEEVDAVLNDVYKNKCKSLE